MNNQTQKYARYTLKTNLAQCSDGQQFLFKRMYAKGKVELPIDTVVDNMDTDRLDWAMQ